VESIAVPVPLSNLTITDAWDAIGLTKCLGKAEKVRRDAPSGNALKRRMLSAVCHVMNFPVKLIMTQKRQFTLNKP